jgi:hypothetical protein
VKALVEILKAMELFRKDIFFRMLYGVDLFAVIASNMVGQILV